MNREELIKKYGEPRRFGDKSMIRLVDVMGDDGAIVQAARVSYGAGTTTVSSDEALIRYLMRHSHTSPTEMCEIKLHIKVPMHVARQWIRHRMASINEYSTRYSLVQDEFELVSTEGLRLQSVDNKQGSSGFLADEDYDEAAELGLIYNSAIGTSYAAYTALIDAGVAREQARNVLPLATMTELYWKIDLHNLLHFLRLRMHSHAQLEIRELANGIAEIVRDWVPLTWKAFEDYKINAITFSSVELAYMLEQGMFDQSNVEDFLEGIVAPASLPKRETAELRSKMKKIFSQGG